MRKHIFIMLFFYLISNFSGNANCNDTLFFDNFGNEITNIKKAKTIRIISRDENNPSMAEVKEFFSNGKAKSISKLVDEATLSFEDKMSGLSAFLIDSDLKTKWLYTGKYLEWYENGIIKKEIDFKNGQFCNKLLTFWENGKPKRIETYNNEYKFLSGICFNSRGKKIDFFPFIVPPYFNPENGSLNFFIQQNFNYPSKLAEQKIAGKYMLYFNINSIGKISKIDIQKELHPLLDKEILRVMSKFRGSYTPAECDGEKVNFKLIIPVHISLPTFTIDLLKHSTGKDTLYFNRDGYLKKPNGSYSIELFEPIIGNESLLIYKTFYENKNLKTMQIIDKESTINNLTNNYNPEKISGVSIAKLLSQNIVLNGQSLTWNQNGIFISKLNYKDNKLNGKQTYYDNNGVISYTSKYENGKLINSSQSYKEQNEKISEKLYDNLSELTTKPEFPGGGSEFNNFINSNIKYPVFAQEKRVEGQVVVQFIINTDGTLSDIKVVNSVNFDLDKEATRIISILPNFIPGTINGVPVRVRLNIPINFHLR